MAFKCMRKQRERALYESQSPELNDPNLTHSPDLRQTLKPTKLKYFYHTGKWEKKEYEEEEAWSCCMNTDKLSEGCSAFTKDKKRWIVSGP